MWVIWCKTSIMEGVRLYPFQSLPVYGRHQTLASYKIFTDLFVFCQSISFYSTISYNIHLYQPQLSVSFSIPLGPCVLAHFPPSPSLCFNSHTVLPYSRLLFWVQKCVHTSKHDNIQCSPEIVQFLYLCRGFSICTNGFTWMCWPCTDLLTHLGHRTKQSNGWVWNDGHLSPCWLSSSQRVQPPVYFLCGNGEQGWRTQL